MQESSTTFVLPTGDRRFGNLRGVRWRINLGTLPSSPSSSIVDLRRVTADSRRRYAALRRRLLVVPHFPQDRTNSPDLAIDNPLSQNPDSTWGRFFHNAKLEKTLDIDLSRLYPEHESFFQSPSCQGMLRRVLLLWCLRHPEIVYRQGMHELLTPLLYVLHVDVQYLSEVRKNYEDHLTDRFDDLAFQERDATCNFDFKKFLDCMEDDETGSQENSKKPKSLDELDPEIQTILLLTDSYGAEGELGIVLSEKFMEHDAYSMFDALMRGANGSVSMADFFSYSSPSGFLAGLPPVIEASSALYHVLSTVDSSLHSHLVELGVEPHYFALRWLRVLFGREFSLENLLIVWDEIFSAENSNSEKGVEADLGFGFKILNSPRGALISAMAVSMILYLRSSLLGTENATSCLQRLLNFPENVDLRKIMEKAKFLQALALDISTLTQPSLTTEAYNPSKPVVVRGHSLSVDSISLKAPRIVVPDSYWEEKWRDVHKDEEQRQSSLVKENPTRKKGWSERVRLRLSRTESDPSAGKVEKSKKEHKSSVRRSLLEDLSRQLGSEENMEKSDHPEIPSQNNNDNHNQVDDVGPSVLSQTSHSPAEVEENEQMGDTKEYSFIAEERSTASIAGEEHSSIFSDTTSPLRGSNYQENDSEKSSIASNQSCDDSNDHEETTVDSPLPVSQTPGNESPELQCKSDPRVKSVAVLKEKKLLSSKFQWLWKFGRNASGIEETSDKRGSDVNDAKLRDDESDRSKLACSSTAGCIHDSSGFSKGDLDQNVMGTLRNLGHSMLEHIQVIESVFQQDRGQAVSSENSSKNGLVEKGQVTAMAALKELRKISNLLSEM